MRVEHKQDWLVIRGEGQIAKGPSSTYQLPWRQTGILACKSAHVQESDTLSRDRRRITQHPPAHHDLPDTPPMNLIRQV
jgi:hypothetical protein